MAIEDTPAELRTILAQIDTAANNRNLAGLLSFYAPEFRNTDGLNRQKLENALAQLWQSFPILSYRTELRTWQRQNDQWLIETVTTINGSSSQERRIQSTIRSRQTLANGRVISQEILAERTQVSIGSNPPTLRVNLPEQVRVGEQFFFDAIVQEPLGDDLLLGAALEETVNSDRYLNPTEIEFTLLPSGGIFKVGRAPLRPEPRWLSAVLVRGSGTVIFTQRLRVVD